MKYLLLVLAVLCVASVASAHGPQQSRRPARRPAIVFNPFRFEQQQRDHRSDFQRGFEAGAAAAQRGQLRFHRN